MQLTKENIAALRKRLMAVRKQGKEYFGEADPKQVVDKTIYPLRESWEIVDAQTLQECEALRQTIKELSVDLAVIRRRTLTPPNRTDSIAWHADRRPTCAPNNAQGGVQILRSFQRWLSSAFVGFLFSLFDSGLAG